jgi:hypothetical protein
MRFLIIGDSWGCGEWSEERDSNNKRIIPHAGTAQYLIDAGHAVTNLSCPADNNWRQLRLAEQELAVVDYDYCIWFQTEPLRNIYEYSPFPDTQDIFPVEQGLEFDELLLEWYKKIYDRADRLGTTVLVVGGLSPLHPVILRYDNLKPVTWAWGEELTSAPQPFNTFWHTGKLARDTDLSPKRMSTELSKCRRYEDAQETSDRFIAQHPDRQAHKQLTERLLNSI